VEEHAVVLGIFVRFRPVGEAKAENDGVGSSTFEQDCDEIMFFFACINFK